MDLLTKRVENFKQTVGEYGSSVTVTTVGMLYVALTVSLAEKRIRQLWRSFAVLRPADRPLFCLHFRLKSGPKRLFFFFFAFPRSDTKTLDMYQ